MGIVIKSESITIKTKEYEKLLFIQKKYERIIEIVKNSKSKIFREKMIKIFETIEKEDL